MYVPVQEVRRRTICTAADYSALVFQPAICRLSNAWFLVAGSSACKDVCICTSRWRLLEQRRSCQHRIDIGCSLQSTVLVCGFLLVTFLYAGATLQPHSSSKDIGTVSFKLTQQQHELNSWASASRLGASESASACSLHRAT
jgi:hypothetical protein